jgi:hypothetical protein
MTAITPRYPNTMALELNPRKRNVKEIIIAAIEPINNPEHPAQNLLLPYVNS